MHAGLAPVIVVGGVKPNLVLVAVVLVTCLAGFLPGITLAFVAGLTANLLVGEPLGSVPLLMLVIAAMVAGGSRVFGGLIWIYPVAAAFVGSIVADLGLLLISQLVTDAVIGRAAVRHRADGCALNAAIVALLLFRPARSPSATRRRRRRPGDPMADLNDGRVDLHRSRGRFVAFSASLHSSLSPLAVGSSSCRSSTATSTPAGQPPTGRSRFRSRRHEA